MYPSGPEIDAARLLVVERNLVPAAFGHLTGAFMTLPFEALGPTKALLKRYFSLEAWTDADDESLADAVGAGEGRWLRELDADLTLAYGWEDGRFRLRVTSAAPAAPSDDLPLPGEDPLAGTFDGPVVPEATPNPRTIRFHVGHGSPALTRRSGSGHEDPSRWYQSAPAAEADRGAARLFSEFAEVANVLVGPDFVAVGLHRPIDWERLLRPVLAVVTEEFASPDVDPDRENDAPRVMGGPARAGDTGPGPADAGTRQSGRRLSRLQQAWRDLASVRPREPGGLDRVKEAAASDDASYRQVAASLLREADARVAARQWAELEVDRVRSVRRAAVDAMVDVDRAELRPLLETALADADAWIRWKALRGLAQLGAGPSRAAVEPLRDDPDFRVRLEAATALRAVP